MAKLRKLAKFCNYGDALNKMLRDQLVWGVWIHSVRNPVVAMEEPRLISDKIADLLKGTTGSSGQHQRESGV